MISAGEMHHPHIQGPPYPGILLERLRRKERAAAEMTDDFEDSFADEQETLDEEDGDGEAPIDPIELAAEIELAESMRDPSVASASTARR